jgi:hypothetical protein
MLKTCPFYCLQNINPPHPHKNGTCRATGSDQNLARFARWAGSYSFYRANINPPHPQEKWHLPGERK